MKVITLTQQNTKTVKDSLHNHEKISESMGFLIILANFFGLFPIKDVSSKNPKSLSFSCKSFKFIYSLYNLIGAGIVAFLSFLQLSDGFNIDISVKIVFYTFAFFATLEFIRLAHKWNFLMTEWSILEAAFRNYSQTFNLRRRFYIMTFIALILATVEHVLYIFNNLRLTMDCPNGKKYTWPIYYGLAHPQIFTRTTFTWWKAVLIEQINIWTTFTWNYTDLFIMLLSSALALRFKQINIRLSTHKYTHEKHWKEIREDYNRLSGLCRTLDQCLSRLVLVSFANNLLFICIQLYNSLKPRYHIIESAYFFFSFGFLLSRTAAVSLYGAWINDESKEPLKFLHSVPSECYFVEISRLTNQIHIDPVAISGCKFFLLTRNFVLKLTGTIVTLELMLLQFGPLLKGEKEFFPTLLCIM